MKWTRQTFGRNSVEPNLREAIQNHFERFEKLHDVSAVEFKDKDGKVIISSLAKVSNVKEFIKEIAAIRYYEKPKLILGADGNTNQVVITAVISDANNINDENVFEDFKSSGPAKTLHHRAPKAPI